MKKLFCAAFAAACLASQVQAADFPVSVTGRVYIDTNSNCRIDSGDALVDGVSIALQNASGGVVDVSKTGEFVGLPGLYSFPSNTARFASPNAGQNYSLQLLLPSGFRSSAAVPGPYAVPRNSYTLKFNISPTDPMVLNPGPGGATFGSYDFLIRQTSTFETFDQDDWGKACGGKARRDEGFGERCWRVSPSIVDAHDDDERGDEHEDFSHKFSRAVCTLLKRNFAAIYPQGLVVGGDPLDGWFSLTLTSSNAVADFLPQNGPAVPLTMSYSNPVAHNFGLLAGETVTLQLNVDFSDRGVTTGLFGSLHLSSGPLSGYSVRDVLALANLVLGGNPFVMPAGVTPSSLAAVLHNINANFDGGRSNRRFLRL